MVLDLKKPFKLVNMVRVDETPLHDAVREALVNCLVNADFYEPRGVVIDKYPDRIVLRNPGTIIVGKRQMLRGGESEPRNGSMMKMFNLIGYGERAGSGVPDIYSVWKKAGYIEPAIEEQFGNGEPNRTVVTLPLVEKDQAFFEKQPEKQPKKQPERKKHNEISQRADAILVLLQDHPSISRMSIAEKTGLSNAQVRIALDTLRKDGKIHREGSARNGKWVVD